MPLQRYITCDVCEKGEGPYPFPASGPDSGAAPPGWILLTVEGSDKVVPDEVANLADTLPDAAWDAFMRMNAFPVQVVLTCCPECWRSAVLSEKAKGVVDGMLAKARGEEAAVLGTVTPFIRPAQPADVWTREDEDEGDVPPIPGESIFDGCR